MRMYCRGHMLAEKLGDCKTANLVVDALISYSVEIMTVFSPEQVAEIYRKASETSVLRKLAVDMWLYAVEPSADGIDHEDGPRKFLCELFATFLRVKSESRELKVGEAFDHAFIANQPWRYHLYDALNPAP